MKQDREALIATRNRHSWLKLRMAVGRARRLGALLPDLISITVLACIGWNITGAIVACADISLYDESNYLDWGRNIPTQGLPGGSYAPLYAVWYFLLGIVKPDPIDLYYFNVRILMLLLPVSVYCAVRAIGARPILSLLVASGIVFCRGNILIEPKVSHFAAVILLFALAVVFRVPTGRDRLFACAIGALVCGYVRPEFSVAGLYFGMALLVWTMLDTFRRSADRIRSWMQLGAFVILVLIVLMLFGPPLNSGDRSLIAFGQHFARNWTVWNGSAINPWTGWEQILRREFGDIHSFAEAVMRRPDLVGRHVGTNLSELTTRTLAVLNWGPVFNSTVLDRFQWLLFLLLFGGALFFTQGRGNLSRKSIGRRVVDRMVWIVLMLVPPMLASVLISPRDHYVLFLALGILIGLAALIVAAPAQLSWKDTLSVVLLGSAMLFVAPDVGATYGYSGSRPAYDTIMFLRALRLPGELRILEAEGGYNIYLGEGAHRIAEYQKATSFYTFLAEKKPNVIVVTDGLWRAPGFGDDAEFSRFMSEPSKYGFEALDLSHLSRLILVSSVLLEQADVSGVERRAYRGARIGAFRDGEWLLDVIGSGIYDAKVDRRIHLGSPRGMPLVGDWNGNGHQRVGFFENGVWYLEFNGDGVWDGGVIDKVYRFGMAGAQPFVGDWNGDDKDEIAIYVNGFWFLDVNGNGVWDGEPTDKMIIWGFAGSTPVTGDWNGDGRTKVGLYKDGLWYLDVDGNGIWDGGTTDRMIAWGWTGTTPVVGDWNGDGKTKVGVYLNGFWFLDMDGNGIWDGGTTDKMIILGWSGTAPVVGDWNGDGKTKVGTFVNGYWYLDYNGNGAWDGGSVDKEYVFGQAGDVPVVGRW